MTKLHKNNIINDTDGKEVIMLRGDKTVYDMMQEQPSSRWDPEYWRPHNDQQLPDTYAAQELGHFTELITYGAILTGKAREFAKQGVYYISSTTVIDTGIAHLLNPLFVKRSDRRNALSKKPHYGDIVFNRSGVGTLGRQCVFLYDTSGYTISDDTDIIRLKGISPFYVSVFLKTAYGWAQIQRRQRGVSGLTKLNFDDIKAIKIPVIPKKIQLSIEAEYIKMSKWHDKAMDAKEKGDNTTYDKSIKKTETMLKDLIARTEAVIRGERDEVI